MAKPTTLSLSPSLTQADIQRIVGAAPETFLLILDENTGTFTAYTADSQTAHMEFRPTNGKYSTMTTQQNHDQFLEMIATLRERGEAGLATRMKSAATSTPLEITRTDELRLKARILLSENHLHTQMEAYENRMDAVQEKIGEWNASLPEPIPDNDDREFDSAEERVKADSAKNANLLKHMPKPLQKEIVAAMNSIPTELLALETAKTAEQLAQKPDAHFIAADEVKLLQGITNNPDMTAMMVTNRKFAESVAKVVHELKNPGDQSHSTTVAQELQKQTRLFKQTTGETLHR